MVIAPITAPSPPKSGPATSAGSFTSTGATIFGLYANTNTPVSIQNAYTYLATPLDSNSQPLLADSAGNALAAIRTYKDVNGDFLRESLFLTFDSNLYLIHNLTLSYGLINWVTNGLFLGQRKISLLAQPDDVFNDNDIWTTDLACGRSTDNTGTTYRMSGNDLQALMNWQHAKQAQPTTPGFMLEMPFNGVGTTATWLSEEGTPAGQFMPDTLTPLAKTNQGQFMWISHTYDHENLDAITAAAATTELQKNNQIATRLGLQKYTKKTLVTPDVSGLTNPNFLQSAVNFGVRYTITDTSKPGYNNPSPNAGIYNPLQPSLLMIPRHPTNLYFNVTKPEQWVAEDNCLYPAGANGHIDTYAQLLDRESNMLLMYLLRSDNDPLMFHQPNLIAYDGAHSLLGDLLDATFAKYNTIFTLPILSPSEEQVGQMMADRIAYNASGVKAQLVGANKITLTAQKDATIPITGAISDCGACQAAPYGKQNVTLVKIKAAQTITVTLKNVAPAPTARLSLASVAPKTGSAAGGNTVTLTGKGFDATDTVTFDGIAATNLTLVSATSITVTAPAHAVGPVAVGITSDSQQAIMPNGYSYQAAGAAGTAGIADAPITNDPAPAPPPRSAPAAPSTNSTGGPPEPTPRRYPPAADNEPERRMGAGQPAPFVCATRRCDACGGTVYCRRCGWAGSERASSG
ncbi:MAG: IPT/TIG domain-containing protein [Thermomicrobiales bacterium]